MVLAIVADTLQILVFPFFSEGALSAADDAFLAELVLGVDLFPFRTLAVISVYRKWKQITITTEESMWRPTIKPSPTIVKLCFFQQVEDNLAALRILEQEAQTQNEAVVAAQKSLDLSIQRYKGGATSYLEVTVAQSAALANEATAVCFTCLCVNRIASAHRVAWEMPAVMRNYVRSFPKRLTAIA
jgi:hypothetical protein